MKVILGHTNTDLDCIGSMVLAQRIFPDHRPVRSHLVHPVARNLYNLYEKHLAFLSPADLHRQPVEHVVIVDARSRSRVRELVEIAPDYSGPVEIFDHHGADSADIPGALIRERACGANTTLLGLELMNRSLTVSPDDATVALVGIYADTGRFTHTDVTPEDFKVASFLLGCGASLVVLDRLLRSLRDEQQVDLFLRMANGLVHREVNGHSVQFCTLELEDQVPGLAAVVEKLFEIEEPEALFAVFGIRHGRRTLIIARTRREGVELNKLLEPFGGGGHAQAASAVVKGQCGSAVTATLLRYLEQTLAPAVTAAEIMSEPVHTIRSEWDLLTASLFLERISHTGAPVADAQGRLVGFLTLRDIMKARRAGAMQAPVTAYMSRPALACPPGAPIADVERLMYQRRVGHVPIVRAERLAGIVTRSDVLRFFERGQARNREVLAALSAKGGPEAR